MELDRRGCIVQPKLKARLSRHGFRHDVIERILMSDPASNRKCRLSMPMGVPNGEC